MAVCSGSGGRLISSLDRSVDLYITGDITYHQALEACEKNAYVLDAGHYGTEIFFLPLMKTFFNEHFPSLKVSSFKGDSPWKKI